MAKKTDAGGDRDDDLRLSVIREEGRIGVEINKCVDYLSLNAEAARQLAALLFLSAKEAEST